MKTSTPFATKSSTLTAAAVSLAIGFATQASAGEVQTHKVPAATITESVSISYADSDLATAEGHATLRSKIKRAAEKVCGPTGYREAGSLAVASQNRKCVAEAMETAMNQLDASQVATVAN